MRPRRSLFGPVLLIVLGGVLLARNLNPELPLLHLFAGYWPWILVFWGGFRLVEFALARLLGRRAPEPLGAGAVIVAVFLCFAGSTAHALSRNEFEFVDWIHGRGAWFDLEFDYPLRHEQSIGPGQAVLIRNLEGRIRIVASDQPGLRIAGHKRIRAFSDRMAAGLEQRSLLEISPQAGQVIVQPRPLPERDSRRVSYEVEIEMPAGAALRVEGARGRLDVQGLSGNVTLGGSASIEISDVSGPVRIEARRASRIAARRLASTFHVDGRARRVEAEELAGAVTIDGSAVEEVRLSKLEQPVRLRFNNTDVDLQQLPGHLEITAGAVEIVNATGPLVLNSRGSRRRHIRLERISGALTVDAQRGDLELLAGDRPPERTNVKIESGDISVHLAPNANFSIEATTARGSANHEFGDALKIESHDRAATLRGTRGQGPLLKLETGRGDVRVQKTNKGFGAAVEI
jgi:DUF4097 and DUF4098 domain-containing protein YvlB